MPSPSPTSAPHWLLVINGKSAGDEPLRAAVSRLRADGVRADVRVTWEAGDAQRYVDEALAAGARVLPSPIPRLMALTSRVMKAIAYRG